MTCKEEKKTDTHDQSAQAFISTAELFLEEDAVWSKYLFNWSSGWVIPSLGRVPLVPNVITRFLYVFCWEMWMSDGSVGAFLWKISVQSHTYTSLHVLIVILRVSLDDRWHFFFCFGDAQNIVFLKLQPKQLYVLRSDRRRSEIWYTCDVKTCLYQLMRWPKWNTPTARLYMNTQHAALTADAALLPLSVSSHCLEYLLYRFSAVWLWTVLVPPLQHINSEWQLTGQVAGCHGDGSFVRYLQGAAQQAVDAYTPLFNKRHHVCNQPSCWRMVAGSGLVSCTVPALHPRTLTRSRGPVM